MTKFALVMIDMQKAYFADPALDRQKDFLVTKTNELLNASRINQIPIWNITTEHAEDKSTWTLSMNRDNQGFLFTGSDEVTVLDELHATGAHIIVKTRDSAFFKTNFKSELRAAHISSLIICGVSTQSCITQTAADAYAHDFDVILAREAIATNNSEFHDVALKLLETEYRQTVASNHEILALMASATA